jgi:hypothetical protein
MKTFTVDDFNYDIIGMDESNCSITVEYYLKDIEFTKLFLNIDLPIDENHQTLSGNDLEKYIREFTPVGQMQTIYDRFHKSALVDMSEIALAISAYNSKKSEFFESNIVEENVLKISTQSLQDAIAGKE